MNEREATPNRRGFLGRLLAATGGAALLARAGKVEAAPEGFDEPFVGEIRMFAGNFAPSGWMFCEGQLVPILENETLYNLIGTIYGGDGTDTFALPDLRGRAPIHSGSGIILGETGGGESAPLDANQIPSHTHPALANSGVGGSPDPAGCVPAMNGAGVPQYAPTADVSLSTAAMLSTGGSQPHDNMQPYLAIHFIISLYGVFPQPS